MARHKDANWSMPDEISGYDCAHLAVMMDVRDELKKLNAVFACQNFQDVPRELRAIHRELTKIRKGVKS